jgi:hypothetical protein
MTDNGTRNNIHDENVYTLKRLSDRTRLDMCWRNFGIWTFLDRLDFLQIQNRQRSIK